MREAIPGVGVTRYRYDLAGRLVWTQGPKHGTRRFAYDAAGQLIRAINGVGGTTSYEYDALGRLAKTTDPLGGVTSRTYSHLNKVLQISDPLGRTTTASYDAAGRQVSQRDPDGGMLSWEYDRAGQLASASAGGCEFAARQIDHALRAEEIQDSTRGDFSLIQHRLTRDPLGRLVGRSRGEETTRWEYDTDGLRTRMITSAGDRVSYTHDVVGRLSRIEHSAFGVVTYAYDEAGRVCSVQAGDSVQEWKYQDGFPVTYIATDVQGRRSTAIERDREGRITRISGPEGTAQYTYDDACQLVRADALTDSRHWEYDRAGRLVEERGLEGRTGFEYDPAGQLVRLRRDSSEVTFEYDGAGRRTLSESSNGVLEYEWDVRGTLSRVNVDGEAHDLWVDALGELASAGKHHVSWDGAAVVPTLSQVGEDSIFVADGGVIGTREGWSLAGWRPLRAFDPLNPWQPQSLVGEVPSRGIGAGESIGMTANGSLQIADLEWMGARAYDPSTRGFLSVDPLQPVVGVAWEGNPYSYAGNDPIHALDPHGLCPVTDRELGGPDFDPFFLLRIHRCARGYSHNWSEFSRGDWAREPFWQWVGNGLNLLSTLSGIATLVIAVTPAAPLAPAVGLFSLLTGLGSATIEVVAAPAFPTGWAGGALTILSAIPLVRVLKIADGITNTISIGAFHWGMVSSIGKTGELLNDNDSKTGR